MRPLAPESPQPPEPIAPQPRPEAANPVHQTTVEGRLEAESALEQIRQKMALVAYEFDKGILNRAQFSAMYARYREQREVIERLLERDPGTQAWQQVAIPGQTGFLRRQFEARVLYYAIYDGETPIVTQGQVVPPEPVVKNMLMALAVLASKQKSPPRGKKQIEHGRWLVLIPGKFTTALALFSLEPSAQQMTLVQDLHRDFERANRIALERGIRLPDQLVFPHRALFEKPGGASVR